MENGASQPLPERTKTPPLPRRKQQHPSMSGEPDEIPCKGFAEANDVVVAEDASGGLHFSNVTLQFDRKAKPKGGPGTALETAGRAVQLLLNGQLQPQLYMRVGEDGYCTFPDGRAVPPPEATRALKMLPGVNALRFEMRFPRDKRVLVAECFVFLWSAADARVIAVDIDGTITRSDLPGLLMTFSPGTIDHTHEGVCACLNWITDAGAQVLYLTSRPITLASKTRNFLMNLRQDGMLLPLGPLITSKSSVSGVLFKELVLKDMHIFKSAALLDIVHVFRRAGRFGPPNYDATVAAASAVAFSPAAASIPAHAASAAAPMSAVKSPAAVASGEAAATTGGTESEEVAIPSPTNGSMAGSSGSSAYGGYSASGGTSGGGSSGGSGWEAPPVFVAGIGNRDTDGLAYLAAGVPPEYIYIIDPTSAIQRWSPSTAVRKRYAGHDGLARYEREAAAAAATGAAAEAVLAAELAAAAPGPAATGSDATAAATAAEVVASREAEREGAAVVKGTSGAGPAAGMALMPGSVLVPAAGGGGGSRGPSPSPQPQPIASTFRSYRDAGFFHHLRSSLKEAVEGMVHAVEDVVVGHPHAAPGENSADVGSGGHGDDGSDNHDVAGEAAYDGGGGGGVGDAGYDDGDGGGGNRVINVEGSSGGIDDGGERGWDIEGNGRSESDALWVDRAEETGDAAELDQESGSGMEGERLATLTTPENSSVL